MPEAIFIGREERTPPGCFVGAAADCDAAGLALRAVCALLAEADLTPKPALVDRRGPGAHADLSLDIMCRSARSLLLCFREMALAAVGAIPCQDLRERLAAIGRDGERTMFQATGGVNTHKGAIWALGLLVAGAAISPNPSDAADVAVTAARIARYPDTVIPIDKATHGSRAVSQYRVAGARGEACEGFPHVVECGLPALRRARARGVPEVFARLDALLAIMASLDDTCLLHRGGRAALDAAKRGAREVLERGGSATAEGRAALHQLDRTLLERNASPGGSGDLLAATLFLDGFANPSADLVGDDFKYGDELPWNY